MATSVYLRTLLDQEWNPELLMGLNDYTLIPVEETNHITTEKHKEEFVSYTVAVQSKKTCSSFLSELYCPLTALFKNSD